MMINSSSCDKAKGAALNQTDGEEIDVIEGEKIGKRMDRKRSREIAKEMERSQKGRWDMGTGSG